MQRLAAQYGIPTEVMRYVEVGLLQILREDEAQRTVEFHLALLQSHNGNGNGHAATFALTWIHPEVKERFDPLYVNGSGELPNSFVTRNGVGSGDEEVDGLETVDDLLAWLGQHAVSSNQQRPHEERPAFGSPDGDHRRAHRPASQLTAG